MSAATPLQALPLLRAARAGREGSAAAEPAPATLAARPLAAILTVFWMYVAVSDVLYARSMSIATDPDGTRHIFAAWDARVLQHAFLYPILLGCVWTSLRVGWRPLWRVMPIQLALGVAFAAVASPLLGCCEWLVGEGKFHPEPWSAASLGAAVSMHDSRDFSTWFASATSFLLTYGFALALVTGAALYRRYKESELRRAALERAWSGARLAALRMQLSPHTLFNLLHTIRGQIAWNPDAARQMVVQLGDLLRRLLAAGERDLVPLTDEIEFVRLYLELQRQRFADRLSVELPQAGALPHTWVPSLILQPLVENAVSHGLADHTGPVVVRVEADSSGNRLTLRVTNTMAAPRARADRALGGPTLPGIGLRNVRERLAVHFGARGTLEAGAAGEPLGACAEAQAGARLSAGSQEPTAQWVAEIRIPLLAEPS